MHLKEPINVGSLKLSNRLVLPPMATHKSNGTGQITKDLIEHYLLRAEGGYIGLVITEHSFVCAQGRASLGQMSMANDDVISALKNLTDLLHQKGSRVFSQINHAGGMASPEYTGEAIVSASAVQNPSAPTQGFIPKELTVLEIHEIQEKFIEAAIRAQQAGFDGVEIHAAHAYLLNEFYSPLTNYRKDVYGGSLENRIRFLREILRGVKDALGKEFPVAVRLGGCDYMSGGNSVHDAVQACRLLEQDGVDLIDISGGMCRYIRKDCTIPGYFADTSSAVRANVSVPVILTGGITTHEAAEQLLENGAADLIGVGRAMLHDARWAEKAMT